MSIRVRSTAKGPRYDVRVRFADGHHHSKTFPSKRAAVAWESKQVTAASEGTTIQTRAGAATVSELAERWMAAGVKRDSTRLRDRSIVTKHLVPGLGPARRVSSISRADCQALIDKWQTDGLAPRTVTRQYAALRAMLQLAVDTDLIARNPAARLKLPVTSLAERPNLDEFQLERLAAPSGRGTLRSCGAAQCWAEVAGLTVGSLDMLGGKIKVFAQIDRHGVLVVPKTSGSVRTLAVPPWLIDYLAQILRERSLDASDASSLVFVNETGGHRPVKSPGRQLGLTSR